MQQQDPDWNNLLLIEIIHNSGCQQFSSENVFLPNKMKWLPTVTCVVVTEGPAAG